MNYRIAITGTPGTGKTTVSSILEKKYEVIHLNKLVKQKNLSIGYDEERKSEIVDLDSIEKNLPEEGIIEAHFSHLFENDKTIVLRCHPEEIRKRLSKCSERKIKENQEAEAIDKILVEAMENSKNVHEIDTTDKSKKDVANKIEKIIKDEISLRPGQVDWSDWLLG